MILFDSTLKQYYANCIICSNKTKHYKYKSHVRITCSHKCGRIYLHHINGIKDDNRIDNLQLMTKGEHSRLHRLEELKLGYKLFVNKNQRRE